jgi:hypothetical protein
VVAILGGIDRSHAAPTATANQSAAQHGVAFEGILDTQSAGINRHEVNILLTLFLFRSDPVVI